MIATRPITTMPLEMATVPLVDKFTLASLSPANAYISIPRAISDTFRQCAYLENGTHHQAIQNIITAMIAHGQVRLKSAVILDPPQAQDGWPGNYLLARFWFDTEWIKEGWPPLPIHFRCKLVSGSPRGNMPMTIVITMADIEDGD